ncbi:tRNA uridine-5-carboxymethylaminomethyl(34) synthesis enzyme MnmG [Halarsenatibacter silvermanii]|uniref:tRNA uridine 5-carboxymethylaminomethyl modification enzyme MnmG n=1 Tax=Halarsenatibacter silvermanii TaxID=321763 RepID=A0A1G9Q645_9FIRM|nr:tRNA uridine-5-carboxymethylaminomethyl(34) synthesis enzyme MnmG [Halarsenatibacter silvermanii]SDM06211.1 tRNA uridine 5-carboxymethylaminomethyl modification enzyme [Halarsenatibacter silvermanii]
MSERDAGSGNYTSESPKKYDVIVVGAGHAGCEAALAPARMGYRVLVLTVNLDHVAFMPCNPSLGGPGKAHIAREIDALGGEMAVNMDKTMTQIRMVNTSKGPAVQALRGQADKARYHERMKQVLENQQNLDLKQDVVVDLVVEEKKISGVVTKTGILYRADKVILTTGTFLRACNIIGEARYSAGPNQQYPANSLSESLEELNFDLLRFMTTTPPRVKGSTVDFSKMREQPGDKGNLSFSFTSDSPLQGKKQDSCWLTHTTEKTHELIRSQVDRAPLISGEMEGTGPRYCPSIEDKVVEFPDKDSHQLFLEPEGRSTDEFYISGLFTGLPLDVQQRVLETIPGLERAEIMRPGYAIEYDCVASGQFDLTLETDSIEGLYTAGQINGTSGYEEAGGQGLIAGINAALALEGRDPLILQRSEAYIGVLIDELVTKNPREPYRMLTSRAEYRLLLRQDNADQRLTPLGRETGLVSDRRWEIYKNKKEQIEELEDYLNNTKVTPTRDVIQALQELDSGGLKQDANLEKILRRPEISYPDLKKIVDDLPEYPREVFRQVEISNKYQGYIDRQRQQIKEFERMENRLLPEDINYDELSNLRQEAREKLSRIRPRSLGQASRISGVSPADISALMIYLEKEEKADKEKEE